MYLRYFLSQKKRQLTLDSTGVGITYMALIGAQVLKN